MTNRSNRSNRQKVTGPTTTMAIFLQVSLMICNNPMETWNSLIDYKNFPFDESTESTESTKVCGALLLRLANEMQQFNGKLHFSNRYKNFPFDKSTESTKVYGALLHVIRLANEMQQSNGRRDFSNRI